MCAYGSCVKLCTVSYAIESEKKTKFHLQPLITNQIILFFKYKSSGLYYQIWVWQMGHEIK